MLLIDGYNVLHQGTSDLGQAVAGIELTEFMGLLARSRYRGRETRVVCDGNRPPHLDARFGKSGEHRVIFTGSGTDADAWIKRFVQRDSGPGRLLVVTSDRDIQRAVRKRGARVVGSRRFLSELVRDGARAAKPGKHAPGSTLDRLGVDHWLQEFGIDQGTDPLLALEPSEAPKPSKPKAGPSERGTRKPIADRRRAPGEKMGVDPELLEARRVFGARLRLEDLDMRRWLREEPGDGLG
ncbi:MAG: NYN domain-containing protein [Planctomycetota bacterium]